MWIVFKSRSNYKQNEKHDFSHYLILDRTTNSQIMNGVWKKDVLGGFPKILLKGVRLFGVQGYST